MTDRTMFETVAVELDGAFELGKRDDGSEFWSYKDDAPTWIEARNVSLRFHQAVGDRLPDDWFYDKAVSAADFIQNYDNIDDAREAIAEFADSENDITLKKCNPYYFSRFDSTDRINGNSTGPGGWCPEINNRLDRSVTSRRNHS